MAQKQRPETLVGLFLVIGLIIMTWLILQLGNFKETYDETYEVHVLFEEAGGIIKGTSVKLAGASIGEVITQPVLEKGWPARVRVTLALDSERRLPSNANFQIQSATVLGDKFIRVSIPASHTEDGLLAGAVVKGLSSGGLEQLQNDAITLAQETKTIMRDTRETMAEFNTVLANVNTVTDQLNQGLSKVNQQVLSPENLTSFSSLLKSISRASHEAESTMLEIRKVSVQAGTTLKNIDQQLTQVGPAFEEVPATMQSIRQVAEKTETTLDELQSSDGLLNSLARDQDMKTDTKTFVKNLRRHGILGYRDEEFEEKDPRERFRGRRR